MQVNRMIPLVLLFVSETVAWNGPSFTSAWIDVQSQGSTSATRTATISHPLGEFPAKVDVQVKVSYNGMDYIFTAAGAPQRDDDFDIEYGTVVYTYNDVEVRLAFPFRSGVGSHTYNTGGVACTGTSILYNGPWNERFNTGKARVRIWRLSDFPTPMFTKYTWMSTSTSANSYKEVQFNTGVYPDLVTVQTRLYTSSNTDAGYMSDGQGTVFQSKTNEHHELFSGLVFGYDDNKVRLWVPTLYSTTYHYNGAIYSTRDGWEPDAAYINGNVTIRGYVFPPAEKVFEETVTATTSSASTNTVDWSSAIEEIENALISVQVKADASDSSNPGMLFYAAGSAQSTDISNYGGVVFAYKDDQALLWTPTSGGFGNMIYIAERWGGGQMSTVAANAEIIVRVYADGRVQCPQPVAVTNAKYVVTELKEGGIVEYTCNAPYIYGSGDLNRTCNSTGHWNGTLPSCIEYVTCGDPSQVPFTTYVLSGYEIGDMVNYSCNGDYYLDAGELTLTCVDGSWAGTTPACYPAGCSMPDTVENSSNTTNKAQLTTSRYPDGTMISYVCDSGYTLIGDSSRSCNEDGNWEGTCPICFEIKCPTPDGIDHGSYTPSVADYKPGSSVTYQCGPEYTMVGVSVSRSCNSNGTWDGVSPACVESGCSVPDPVENASNTTNNVQLSTSRYPDGTVISYVCNSGYTLIGVSSRRCDADGNWDGTCPTCIAIKCPVPDGISYGSYTPSATNYLPGNSITYQCDLGYAMIGDSGSRLCNSNGTWDGMPPACVAIKCHTPDDVGNGSYTPSQTDYLPGSSVIYQCDTGYNMVGGSVSRICNTNGTWDGVPPACAEIRCSDPGPVTNASYTVYGFHPSGQVKYTCNNGTSRVSGDSIRTCQSDGTWDGLPVVCSDGAVSCTKDINCPIPDTIGNGSYTPLKDQYPPSSVIMYQCDSGFYMIPISVSRTCNVNGSWDGIPPACVAIKCPTPDDIGNGTYTPSTSEYLPGSSITYHCNLGFEMVGGSFSRSCDVNGFWVGVPPACVERRCLDPGPVFNASYIVNGYHPTQTAQYTCNPGTSSVSGNFIRTCQSDGTWDGIPVVCSGSPGTCAAPNAVVMTDVELAERVAELQQELIVEYKSTTSYYRSLNSASDDRPSSSYIAIGWTIAILSVLGALVISDCIGIYGHVKNYGNIFKTTK